MGPGIRVETFDRLTIFGRRWFFRGVDTGNGEICFPSQPYKDRRSRNATAMRLAVAFGTVPVNSER